MRRVLAAMMALSSLCAALGPAVVAQGRDARFFTVGVIAWGQALDGRYELQIGDTAWTIRRGGFQLVESERPQHVVLWRTSDCRVLARFLAGPQQRRARNTIVIGDGTGHISWSHGGSDAVDTTTLDDHPHAPSCSLADTSTSDASVPSASPGPSSSPSPAAMRWQPVDGLLGGAVPMLSVGTGTPILAAGRFWALETLVAATPPGGTAGSAEWRDPGVWASDDGRSWVRYPLPERMHGQLSLMPWRGALAIIEQTRVYGSVPGRLFRVWTSRDGVRWLDSGGLDLQARGALRGCGFSSTEVTTAGDHLVVIADCEVLVGAGGDLDPGYRSQVSAVRFTVASQHAPGIPTYTWTSLDAKSWTRHRVDVRPAARAGFPWLSQVQAIGRGMAVVTRERRPRLLWSTDGASFRTVASLPNGRNPVADVDATVSSTGRPRTWVILTQDVSAATPGQAAPGAVTRLEADGTWRVTLRTGPPEQVDIATDGDRILVVDALEQFAGGQASGVTIETSESVDQGLTWAATLDPTVIAPCLPQVTLSTTAALLDCSGFSQAILRRAAILRTGP